MESSNLWKMIFWIYSYIYSGLEMPHLHHCIFKNVNQFILQRITVWRNPSGITLKVAGCFRIKFISFPTLSLSLTLGLDRSIFRFRFEGACFLRNFRVPWPSVENVYWSANFQLNFLLLPISVIEWQKQKRFRWKNFDCTI